jgi:hypothetical protein
LVATPRRHFREELDLRSPKANVNVAHMLWQKALGGNKTLMVFWMKARAQQKNSAW